MNFWKRCNLLIEELAGIHGNKHFREHFLYEFASLGITKQQCSTINYALRYKDRKKHCSTWPKIANYFSTFSLSIESTRCHINVGSKERSHISLKVGISSRRRSVSNFSPPLTIFRDEMSLKVSISNTKI